MNFKCQYCQRIYMMEWAKKRHERLCKEKKEAMEKHPERYSKHRSKKK